MKDGLGIGQFFPAAGMWYLKGIGAGRAVGSLADSGYVVKEPSFLHSDWHDANVVHAGTVRLNNFVIAKFRILAFGVAMNE